MTGSLTDPGSGPVHHPRIPASRGGRRTTSWWGKAWLRAVEESAYGAPELRTARRLARIGAVGTITVEAGAVVAAVDEPGARGSVEETWTVRLAVPELTGVDAELLVELVAAESGRLAALLAGDLPHRLVEEAEDSGVELLPYGGEIETACGCDAWMAPCAHALAVQFQLGWLLDRDPLVLLGLRGLPRDQLVAALHRIDTGAVTDPDALARDRSGDGDAAAADLDLALDAVARARGYLEELGWAEGRGSST